MLIIRLLFIALAISGISAQVFAQSSPLVGTSPLEANGDLAKAMVEGIHVYLDRGLAASEIGRSAYWHRDLADGERYSASIAPNRERLKRMIGATDVRDPVRMRLDAELGAVEPGLIATGRGYRVYRVRWNVFREIGRAHV